MRYSLKTDGEEEEDALEYSLETSSGNIAPEIALDLAIIASLCVSVLSTTTAQALALS